MRDKFFHLKQIDRQVSGFRKNLKKLQQRKLFPPTSASISIQISASYTEIKNYPSDENKRERFCTTKPSSFTSFPIKNILDFVVTGKLPLS